ncbi:TniQ family protein [Rhizobium halophilum]|uniref:TniQ family protein n=1 Tax=Rhizobium halophilum TaxID=2846852 RepID=UPI001EFEC292|nr:TniQ family protein [Rhizobium halophilum]MCF6367600.1 TniQ family protein [Rhizobium halophilum]
MNSHLFRIERPFSKWRVRPFPGEGAFSYFHRLVKDQGNSSPITYAQAVGLPGSKVGGSRLLRALAKLPLLPEEMESLHRWTPIQDGTEFSLNGFKFPDRILSARNHRHCPACILEAPFQRSWWNLSGFEQCPKHLIPLKRWTEDQTYRVWPPFYGVAQHDATAQLSAESCSSERFETYVLARLGAIDGQREARPLLDDNPLDDVIWYSGGVGRLLNNPRSIRRPFKRSNDHQRGFEALRLDREHLVNSLADWLVIHNTPVDLQQASNHTLGWGNALVQIKSYSRHDSALGKEVALAQAFACARVGKVGSQHRGYKGREAWPVSRKRAAALLGVTEAGVQVLSGRIGGSGRFFDKQALDAMEALLERTCSRTEALRALACSDSQLRVLTSKRVVARIYMRKSRRYRILKEDVDALVAKLDALPLALSDEVDVEEFARRNAVSVSTVMIGFLRGKYQGWRSRSHSGFRKLRLLSSIRAEPRTRGGRAAKKGRKQSNDIAMLRTEFRVMSHLRPKTVLHLIATGQLPTVPTDTGESRLLRKEAMAFHMRYMNPAPYLRGYFRYHSRELEQLGVPIMFKEAGDNLIVERDVFEQATGIKTIPDDEHLQSLWGGLKDAFLAHAPSFIIPDFLGGIKFQVWTTSIKASFDLAVGQRGFRFVKRFSARLSRRDWEAYERRRNDLLQALEPFVWEEETGTAVAAMYAEHPSEIDAAAIALGRMCEIFRYRQPVIRRLLKD